MIIKKILKYSYPGCIVDVAIFGYLLMKVLQKNIALQMTNFFVLIQFLTVNLKNIQINVKMRVRMNAFESI